MNLNQLLLLWTISNQLPNLCNGTVHPFVEVGVYTNTIYTIRVRIDPEKHVAPREIHKQIVVTRRLVPFRVSLVLVFVNLHTEPKQTLVGMVHQDTQVHPTLRIATSAVEIHKDRLIPNPPSQW